MQKILLILTVLFAQILLGAPTTTPTVTTTTTKIPVQKMYEVKMDLTIKGILVGSPTVLLMEGDISTAAIDSKEGKFFVSLTTAALEKSEKYKDSVHLKFAIGKISTDGKETIIGKPSIIAILGQDASIAVGEAKKEDYLLELNATLKK